jgi:transcriptional regulator of acetoin/glycerol metabolism
VLPLAEGREKTGQMGRVRAISVKHAEQILAVARDPSAPARSAISASWMRSLMRYGLDPADKTPPRMLTDHELREAREPAEALLASAQGTLDRLFQAVGDTGCCVLFATADGIPIDRRGMPSDNLTFREWGLWPGAMWSEACEGTNGIGTCLADERAMTIHRDQHFHSRNIALSCTTAPVYDHRGRLAAALDVSSCRSDLTADFVGLIAAAVADAARRIEARHFRTAFPGARIVLAPDTDWGAGALLAIDRDDVVVGANRAARIACNITDARLAAMLRADEVLADDDDGPAEDFEHAERVVLQRALARATGNVSAAAKALGVSRATMHRKMRQLGLQRCRAA